MNNYESIKEVLLFGISIIFIYNILINIFIKIIDYDKNDENLNFKIYILFSGLSIAITVIIYSIVRPDLFEIEKKKEKKERFTNRRGQMPKDPAEIKSVLEQLVTREMTTYVEGEEGNYQYPLSTMYAGSESYNSNPDGFDANSNIERPGEFKTSYGIGENDNPVTFPITVNGSRDGTPFLPPVLADKGGLGSF